MENQQANQTVKTQNDKKPIKKILFCTLMPVALILAFVGGYFSQYLFKTGKVNTTAEILSIIEKNGYIYDVNTGEEKQITQEDIADILVSGILDKYADYYTAEELATVNENARGNYSGIGINYNVVAGEIVVVTLNSPADRAGVKEKDKIVSVSVDGGQTIPYSQNQGEDFRQALSQTANGQTVRLTVLRDSQQLSFDIVKQAYVATYVQYFDSQKVLNFRGDNSKSLQAVPSDGGMPELDGDTAYVRLTKFNGGAGGQMKQALNYMRERGRSKLILDLRNNGGGYISILIEIASCFINNGGNTKNLVAVAQGKDRVENYYTTGNNFYDDLTAISVLANDQTASASECLIGAMLHYKDGFNQSRLIIEKNSDGVAKTYGKGIMQTTYPLTNGGALKLTTAKIYLPDGVTSIHDKGFIATGENAVSPSDALARAIAVLG